MFDVYHLKKFIVRGFFPQYRGLISGKGFLAVSDSLLHMSVRCAVLNHGRSLAPFLITVKSVRRTGLEPPVKCRGIYSIPCPHQSFIVKPLAWIPQANNCVSSQRISRGHRRSPGSIILHLFPSASNKFYMPFFPSFCSEKKTQQVYCILS